MSDATTRYIAMVRIIRGGGRLPEATVRRVLVDAAKTADDYLSDTCPGTADHPVSGDDCPQCNGRLSIVDSRVRDGHRIRFLGCRSCGHRPEANKLVGTIP